MKKHNLFKVVGISILVAVLLTWILPTTYYQYELTSGARSQVGLFDLLKFPSIILSYFGDIVFYILIIGGFYGILNKIGAYRSILDSIAKKAKGKEMIILAAIIFIITALTSVCGASFGILMIVPFIVSLVLVMGYDKITAAMVTVGSIAIGLMGTTFGATFIQDQYGSSKPIVTGTGVFNSILNTNATSLILAKIIILIFGIALLVFWTLRHASKNHDSKKNVDSKLVPAVIDTKKKSWPLIVVLDLTFVIMLLAQTSWTSVFGVKIFNKATEFLLTKVKPFGFPIIGKILGNISEFEQWGLVEISALLVIASIIIALIYKIRFNDYIENAFDGIKKAIKPAILVVLVYVVLIIGNSVVLTITSPLITATKGLNAFTMSLAALITSIFNVDVYYIATPALIYTSEVITSGHSVIAFIWQTMYGFAVLFAPTSVILVPILSYLDVSYGKWIKSNWLLILGMLGCSLIVSTVLVLTL